jgi:selenocysteine-specific elongation factor
VPSFKTSKKIKSIQVFRRPVDKVMQGDRCGICVTNFDSKQFERGIVCAPGYVQYAHALIINLNRIKHYKSGIHSGAKYHITIAHETILGRVELFAKLRSSSFSSTAAAQGAAFNFNEDYMHIDEYDDQRNGAEQANNKNQDILAYYALVDFTQDGGVGEAADAGVLCVPNSLLIGSKLDTDIHLNQCRIAFYGNVLHMFTNDDFKSATRSQSSSASAAAAATATTYAASYLSMLRVYKEKSKEGQVERKHDENTLIGRSLFKKETNVELFVGLKVQLSTGEWGVIESSFGQSGKFKIRMPSRFVLCSF